MLKVSEFLVADCNRNVDFYQYFPSLTVAVEILISWHRIDSSQRISIPTMQTFITDDDGAVSQIE